jgi:hypothetical protein
LASIFNRRRWFWERRRHLLAPLLATTVLFSACVSVEKIAPPVAQLSVGGSAMVLEHGRHIYLGKCTSCHAAEPVAKYPATRWPGIIREMSADAKLSADDESAVLAYVLAARREPVR